MKLFMTAVGSATIGVVAAVSPAAGTHPQSPPGDDDFARLSHVAIWNTRQVEFGRELPYAGRLSYGGMVEGPPATTTWLRLAHTTAGGLHRYRAGWSTDGRHWHRGGTWTFPIGTTPRIGLVSHGGDQPPATAVFDYFRVYRP